MRISKDTAWHIAIKLCEKFKTEYEQFEKEYEQLVIAEYKKQVPKEVYDMQKKHPDYFETVSGVRLLTHGFNHETVCTEDKDFVISNNGGNYANIKLDKKLSSTLMTAKRKFDSAKEKHKKLLNECKQALINLGTVARIKDKFPEAIPFLPVGSSMALVLNYDSLRKKIA